CAYGSSYYFDFW
nr:immunoglobulin heavy chain junction region [Mus musculus]